MHERREFNMKNKFMLITMILALFNFLVFVGCGKAEEKDAQNRAYVTKSTSDSLNESSIVPIYPGILKGTIGVVVGTVGDSVEAKMKIYNKDGSLWNEVSFTRDQSGQQRINPFAWHPDNFLLVFRCLDKSNTWYTIVVNEETEEVKYIRINDPLYRFKTWEEHILSTFSVGFDYKSNPIREASSIKADVVSYEPDEFYHPVEIVGDWLQIKWGEEGDYTYGWIKWRFGNDLLVELFYSA
jgi:hypothetical protein